MLRGLIRRERIGALPPHVRRAALLVRIVGKSALLEAVSRAARARDLLVLQATGVPSEADLPFAGLHQLLHTRVADLSGPPGPQEAAFGMTGARRLIVSGAPVSKRSALDPSARRRSFDAVARGRSRYGPSISRSADTGAWPMCSGSDTVVAEKVRDRLR
jgi:hypothetical protein